MLTSAAAQAIGNLRRNGTVVTCWNTDNFGHEAFRPMYQTMPWVVAVLPDGRVAGLTADTTQVPLHVSLSTCQ